MQNMRHRSSAVDHFAFFEDALRLVTARTIEQLVRISRVGDEDVGQIAFFPVSYTHLDVYKRQDHRQ